MRTTRFNEEANKIVKMLGTAQTMFHLYAGGQTPPPLYRSIQTHQYSMRSPVNKENISARVVQHNALDHPATAADSADLFVERAACRQAWERCDAELKNAHADPVELHHAGTRLKQQLAGLAVSEDALRRLAYHDVLTGLANRLLLREYFCHELVQAGRRETRLAALFVDLDRFKDINDTYGHAAGDEVLKQVAARLLSCVRAGDIVSRYAGDEFVLVLVDIGALANAAQIARKIIAQLSAPYPIDMSCG